MRGFNVITEHVVDGEVDSVMFIESEVGHDIGRGVSNYFEELCERLKPLIRKYRIYSDNNEYS